VAMTSGAIRRPASSGSRAVTVGAP